MTGSHNRTLHNGLLTAGLVGVPWWQCAVLLLSLGCLVLRSESVNCTRCYSPASLGACNAITNFQRLSNHEPAVFDATAAAAVVAVAAQHSLQPAAVAFAAWLPAAAAVVEQQCFAAVAAAAGPASSYARLPAAAVT